MHISCIQKLIDCIRGKRKKTHALETKIQKTAKIDAKTKIGKYCYVGDFTYITRATIGNYCSIGNFVTIGPGEHSLESISTSTYFEKDDVYNSLTAKPCIIGNDVWIGIGAIIRRGIKIGNGAVIGANSFVNKDVPDFAIVAGSPAKIIRYRFSEGIQKKIIDSHWWNADLQEAKQKIQKILEDA